jgi:hypothetical protein
VRSLPPSKTLTGPAPQRPGLLNWRQIAAYWAGPDDFITRMGNPQTGNGVPLLDATTVTATAAATR